MIQKAVRGRTPSLWSLLLLPLYLGSCASGGERVYVAPSPETVTARLEASYDGRGQHIIVDNRSSVQIVVTSLNLHSCENIKNHCDVRRLRVPVRARSSHRLATVEPDNPNRASNFRYSWTWEASGAVPEIPGQAP